jgi:hypothetical protein
VRRPRAMAKAFKGRWRISEMDVWDNDYLDLVEPAHIVFESENDGAFVFGTVKGWLDVRYGARDGSACAEFSWEGLNDTDPACGRGWVILGTAGRLVGTSSSTTAMTPASSPNANEFFNSLLVLLSQKAAWCGRGSEA